MKDYEIYNQGPVVITDRINSEVSLTQADVDLYSNNAIRLVGMNLDGVVHENNDGDNNVICDLPTCL